MIDLKEKSKLDDLSGIKLYSEEISDIKKILGFGEELKDGDYIMQGDCILAQIGDENFENSPKEITGELSNDNVILKGTINSHALYDGGFDIYRDGEMVFIDVKTFAILDHVRDVKTRSHAEHHQQYIPKGKYYFRGIQEFDHLEKMARQVID
jgi:hypothetical protein